MPGCNGWIRTSDLQVMSLARAAAPLRCNLEEDQGFEPWSHGIKTRCVRPLRQSSESDLGIFSEPPSALSPNDADSSLRSESKQEVLNRQSTTSVHLNAYARPSIWPLGYLHR